MQRYFLGVDIGATKSHALIADEEGQAVGFGAGGPGNHEVVGYEGLRTVLHSITHQALTSADIGLEQIAGAGFGVAGYDFPSEREPTRQILDSLGLRAPYEFVNDTIVGLLAGAMEGWGVVVVAGTSNNCRGRDRQGHEGWITGCGPSFAEYGGAAELVRRAMQDVSKAWSRRGPATRLGEAFIALTGATDLTDLLEGLALERYHLTAAAAPLIFQVAAEGDAVAQEAIRWSGRELGNLAVGVIRQLGFEGLDFEVVLAGSLYDGGPLLTEPLRATIHATAPGARLVRLTAPPVVGGVLLGMEQVGIRTAAVRQRLNESAKRLVGLRSTEALKY
jgi:N-acetylglucosamine kinase-like BadF-type ATPase